MKYIDDDSTHNQVLYELGILDDDDDYALYCKMQNESIDHEIDAVTWCKYITQTPKVVPKDNCG